MVADEKQAKLNNVKIVTAEYTPYEKLTEPAIVGLFAKYGLDICLCVRENQLDDKLDRLYKVYTEADVRIIMWPLLPMKDGLYLNKKTAGVFLDYMDVLYGWMEKRGHRIEALVMDVEPAYVPPAPGAKPPGPITLFNRIRKELGRESFERSLGDFRKIIEKAHSRGSLAIASTFPFVIDDRLRGLHNWEDLFGGPVGTLEWDYVAVMMYTSWFVEIASKLGMTWDAAHRLAYEYSLDIKRLWGDRAALAVGVTNPGQGHETVIYTSAKQIAPAIAAVKAAGLDNIGIYDIKGILDSGDPESWFAILNETKAAVPETGAKAAKRFRNFFKYTSSAISLLR